MRSTPFPGAQSPQEASVGPFNPSTLAKRKFGRGVGPSKIAEHRVLLDRILKSLTPSRLGCYCPIAATRANFHLRAVSPTCRIIRSRP